MKAALLDLVFSRSCAGCGAAVAGDETSLCWDCQTQVRWVSLPYCSRCGDPVAGMISDDYECTWCRRVRPSFDWARSAVRYDGLVKTCLRTFKYREGYWLLDVFAEWLLALWGIAPAAEPGSAPVVVVPVPLYPRRRRERGYNQAGLLGAAFARRAGMPFRENWLGRFGATGSQTRLTAAQRLHNVRGVFVVPWPHRVAGRRIVLVDDVMTTGATVNECARVLRAAGAESVMVLTVARG